MKNKAIIFLVLVLMFATVGSAAAVDVQVYIDGEIQSFDQPALLEKATTMVPMRGIFEKLGASVNWDEGSRTIIATKAQTIISLTLNQKTAYVDGKEIELQVAAFSVNGRTLVPLRFISEALGAMFSWEGSNWSAYINTGAALTQPAATESQSGQIVKELSVSEVAKEARSVVLIKTCDQFGSQFGQGSGFVVRENGVILSSYHVIEGAYSATAEFEDGSSYDITEIIAADTTEDYAFLRLAGATGLPEVRLGDSAQLVLGEKIVAIGNPQGLSNTISDGIVSTVRRRINGVDYIQITAPISAGSSGGPLFNMKGQVVGINTAQVRDAQNINLAIPIDKVKTTLSNIQ